jgi:DNA-binding NtrC family response regulator
MDGMELLGRIMQDDPSLPVIILTAYGTVATAVDALKRGAFDYITKPFEQEELKTIILKAVKTRIISESDLSAVNGDADPYRIVGASSRMAEIRDHPQLSPDGFDSSPETGTGRLIARAIHQSQTPGGQPFIR